MSSYEDREKLGNTSYVEYTNDENEPRMSVGRYCATRFSTLKPPMAKVPNPITLLLSLNRSQWLFFLVGFCGWTWDAFDFFSVSLTITPLTKQFGKTTNQLSWGITVTLMLRSVGAIILGLLSDRYGRKWTYIVNNILFIIIELGTGFCNTYKQFLACRALFGIAMGGMYGNAVATALEDLPPQARGLISGILQVGYIMGYLLATVFARAFVDTSRHGWRPLFWFGAGPPVLFIIFRLCLPETKAFTERERSHGTQDLYPVLLQTQYDYSANAVTVTQVVANLGAFSGGITMGYLSEIFGRRLTILTSCTMAGALVYPYGFISSKKVIAVAFFEQFFIEGVLGVVPVHVISLSPGALRTSAIGTCYQLGSLISSASATIETTLGARFPLPPTHKGVKRYDYGKVICIFTACGIVFVMLVTLIGPEKRVVPLDVAHDTDVAEAMHRDLGEIDKIAHKEVVDIEEH
ncbi:MFS transporter, SHS family, lactate transporter, partial [Lecanoromycetidae sp. Uapishka_2]